MLLLDVNVLVYAFRRDMPEHERYASWLEEIVNGNSTFGVPEMVFSGFLRIVTHSRIFKSPSTIDEALQFADRLRLSPALVSISPGPRHWHIFSELCRNSGVRGNLVPDAYLAALAIESGAEWITSDHDYSRFAGLRWRQPLQ
ncbi:MAG: TA system VapC family ribonuclease toxin [Thermoguttaceae bacterium]